MPHPFYMTRDGDHDCQGCESFAHDISFTHDAIMDLCPAFVALGEYDFDLFQYSYHELAYLYGIDPPNYPVPALIVSSYIEHDVVGLVGFQTNKHHPEGAWYLIRVWWRKNHA